MNIEQYIELSRRTVNPNMSEDELAIMFTLGLCGESSELYLEISKSIYIMPLIEKEIGDICWYLYNFIDLIWKPVSPNIRKSYLDNFLEKPFVTTIRTPLKDLVGELQYACGAFADVIKKEQFHNKGKNRFYQMRNLVYLSYLVDSIIQALELNKSSILQTNVEKLKVRYPNGFKSCSTEEKANEKRN